MGRCRMAHHQKAVAAAVALNTAIFVVEGIAGYQASSLSLLMDSVHNLSDELALVCLYAAFLVTRGPSQRLLRAGNLFNSVDCGQRTAFVAGRRASVQSSAGSGRRSDGRG